MLDFFYNFITILGCIAMSVALVGGPLLLVFWVAGRGGWSDTKGLCAATLVVFVEIALVLAFIQTVGA